MRKIILAFFCGFIAFIANAQEEKAFSQYTQTIRGKVADRETKIPLIGANVVLLTDTANFTGVVTDTEGRFRLEKIFLGRHALRITFLGYKQVMVSDIILSAGKEVVLSVEMEESVTEMKEVEIIATRRKGEVMNEMATVSARAFTVEETDRYAGSRSDPARMASNFAGVQGSDDSRNDIVIRGNSPLGVLWRMEGIDIPNPNHFAISGTQGGPVNIINNKTLANSDFFTGAFPAEFGNSVAGAFDLRMRNGNNEKHEFTGQFGLFGTELMAEGPVSKERRSSYLAAFRYSTFTIFDFLNIDLGTTATPKYYDLNFKVNFPGKKNSNFSIFGLAGKSDIGILISKQDTSKREIYGDNDRDQYFGTFMGVLGMNYTKSLNKKTYAKITLAGAAEEQHSYHKLIYYTLDSLGNQLVGEGDLYLIDSVPDKQRYSFLQGKTSLAAFVNHKVSTKHIIKAGVNADALFFDFQDSVYHEFVDSSLINEYTYTWTNRWDYQGNAFLIQPYIQWKYRISDNLTFNAGLHSQYFSLSNSFSPVEPRLGLKWDFAEMQSLSAGFGMHSQMQPIYTYFYHFPKNKPHNIGMDFTRSIHYVLGYDNAFAKNTRLKFETYYQQLYNVPIEKNSSSFSLLNQGSGFSRFFPDTLENKGTGENYGIEITIEKFFSKKFFFMLTGAYYESFYKGSDGKKRPTDFNGNYVGNLLAAKEFKVGKKNSFTLGTKATYAGNKRYSPVDTAATVLMGEIVYVDAERNTLQFDPYFRWDLKVNFKINQKKVTHEIGIDLVNVLGTQNVLKLTYAPDASDPASNPIREEYQLGRLPIFYYKADF